MTKLAFIMKRLRMTEKRLGELISVDKSLINKWKNGKRELASHSPYIFDIADACALIFNEFDYEDKLNFKNEFPFSFELTNPKAYFVSFLKNNSIGTNELSDIARDSSKVDSIISGDMESYKGNYPLFFKKIQNKRKGTLYCFLSGADNYACYEIMEMLRKNILDIISRDNNVEMIFDSFALEAELKPILYFSELFFNNRFKIYVKKNKCLPKVFQSFLLYDKDIALEVNYVCENREQFYSEIFADSVRCQFTYARFRAELADSFICCEKMRQKSHRSVYTLFQEHSSKISSSYLYLELPLFVELPYTLIKEILSYNKISSNIVDLILRRFSNINELMVQPTYTQKVRMMFSMDSFEKLFSEKNYFIFSLSMFCEQNITVSRNVLVRMLREWITVIRKRDDIELMLTPKALAHNSISCYVKKYYYGTMWRNIPGATDVLFTEDSYNTQLIYSVISEEWKKSDVCIRDKEEVLLYLGNIADRLEQTL